MSISNPGTFLPALSDNGTVVSSTEQITWNTGLGGIVHILGPSDQNLLINGGSGKQIRIGSNNDIQIVQGSVVKINDASFQLGTGVTVNQYKGITTVSNGVPAEYATVDLTAQTAAIAATTLYAVPAAGAGMYRISWVATVTTAGSVSSVLGGTNGFQILYTDKDDSVVKTMPGTVVAGVDTNSTNSTSTGTISGCFVVSAKASTNIQYQMDYTSNAANSMAYNLHIKLEAL